MPAANSNNVPSLAELIREHWQLPTGDLVTIIARHHPSATTAEIVAELRRQASANFAEADALAMAGSAEGVYLMRRDTARLADMQPGGWNYNFDRPWEERPPDEGSRKRSPVATGSAIFGKSTIGWNSTDNIETQRQAQRAAAEALFERVPA